MKQYILLFLLTISGTSFAQEFSGQSPIYKFDIRPGNSGGNTITNSYTSPSGKPKIVVEEANFSQADNIYQPGHSFTLELSVKNAGQYKTQNLRAVLKPQNNVRAFTSSVNVGSLDINSSRTIKLDFFVEASYLKSEVPIQIEFKGNNGFSYTSIQYLTFQREKLVKGFSADRTNKDRALFFAVEDYESQSRKMKSLGNLNNPIKDAKDIAKELEQNFGFKSEVVENPTADEILKKLESYHKLYKNAQYDQLGQLIIFFSGHGIAIEGNGYFLPADATPGDLNCTNCVLYSEYDNILNSINCEHLLVAIDACYSGTFDINNTRDGSSIWDRPKEPSQMEKFYQKHLSYKTRQYFTSGGDEDKTPDKSLFAKSILEGLRSMNTSGNYMTAQELFSRFIQRGTISQARFGYFGDDEAGSSFLFFLK